MRKTVGISSGDNRAAKGIVFTMGGDGAVGGNVLHDVAVRVIARQIDRASLTLSLSQR